MLHIFSSRTLLLLHTITLATPPIFALSLRLLAYASQSPIPHAHGPLPPTFVSRTRDSLSSSVMRVGGEVWSGVKAAVATSAAGFGGNNDSEHAWGFSRSAPASSGIRDQRMHSGSHSSSSDQHQQPQQPYDDTHRPRNHHAASAWVTVLDLMPLLSGTPLHQPPGPNPGLGPGSSTGLRVGSCPGLSGPRRVACFVPFPPEPTAIAHLAFSGVGATPLLCVAPCDGHRVAVFQIRPGSGVTGAAGVVGAGAGVSGAGAGAGTGRGAGTGAREGAVAEMPWHWYDLRRGVTNARVDGVVWEKTGRWVGVATGRRTVRECRFVTFYLTCFWLWRWIFYSLPSLSRGRLLLWPQMNHRVLTLWLFFFFVLDVFPTNPYGGKPDEQSHLGPQVCNVLELVRIFPSFLSYNIVSADTGPILLKLTPQPPLSIELTPIVRLRPSNTSTTSPASPPLHHFPDAATAATAPVSFTFLPLSASLALPPLLLPPIAPSSSRTSTSPTSRSAHASAATRSLSPTSGPSGPRSPSGGPFQDILLFDPASGELALRRVTLDCVAGAEAWSSYSHSQSRPIPVGGGSGSGSGSGRGDGGDGGNGGNGGGVGAGADAGGIGRYELVGKESVVATWGLKRGPDWGEVRSVLRAGDGGHVRRVSGSASREGGKVSTAE